MDNNLKKDKGDPSGSPGGAVDDLTPPTMQGMMPTLHVAPPTGVTKMDAQGPATVTPATQVGELERTMVGVMPSVQTKAVPKAHEKASNGVHYATSANAGSKTAATIAGDIPTQDLSTEQLLRDAPRLESCGQICPALNGIPLLYKLGQGGMGAVYYGIHPRLQSEVAVKVLPFHLAAQDPGMIQRFFREAQIAAKVRSPHLVSVIDVNEESGLFFLVMEYVAGVSMGQFLKKQIEEGRVGLGELDAIDSTIAACMGLDAAHQNGIIHRDLKPDNIMLPYKSRQQKTFDIRNAKLMDLGLARSEEGNQSLTGVQAAMGTPGYMAPEQALDAKTADKRSDVFGMGATLYALLAGRPPFKGDVVMKVLMATMHEPHPPITDFRPDLSPCLVEIIDRCLDKNPENRYADARQMIRALKSARKVLHPDSTFGGEDDGGPEEAVGTARMTPIQAPRIGEPTRVLQTKTGLAVPQKSSKMGLYGAIAAGVAIIATVAYVLANKGTDDPKKKGVEVIKSISKEDRDLVMQAHNEALSGIREALGRNDFKTAEFKFTKGKRDDDEYTKQLPELNNDWTAVRKEIDVAMRGSAFDKAVIEINIALKSGNIDDAKRQAQSLQAETPGQIEEKKRLNNEILREEEKILNKDEFTKVMIEARKSGFSVAEKLAFVNKALDLIKNEPNALDLQKTLKAQQKDELTEQQFKTQMKKARDFFAGNNPTSALKAITEARQLKPNDKDALAFSKEILSANSAETQKEFLAQSKTDALEAYKSAKEFFDKRDSAKALEKITIAVGLVRDDDQFNTLEKEIGNLIAEEERVVKLNRLSLAFNDLIKEANDSLKQAVDVDSIGFLAPAKAKIADAQNLNLDSPKLLNPKVPKDAADVKAMLTRLQELDGQVAAQEKILSSRRDFKQWWSESSVLLGENEIDGKMASIDVALKKIQDALSLAADGKVKPEEIAEAEKLKEKIVKKKGDIRIRDDMRSDVAGKVKKGDEALAGEKYTEALQIYTEAEGIARKLSIAEKNEVIEKMKLATTKINNLKEIDNIVKNADQLIASEKFEDAVTKLDTIVKIMPDKRLALRMAEIKTNKAVLDATAKAAMTQALDAFRSSKLNEAVSGLQSVADAHPSRKDIAGALANFKEIQRIDTNINVKMPELKHRYSSVLSKVSGDTRQQKERADEAFEKLPKVTAATAENLGKSGMAGMAVELPAFSKLAEELINQAERNVIILEGMYREDQAKAKAAQEAVKRVENKEKQKGSIEKNVDD